MRNHETEAQILRHGKLLGKFYQYDSKKTPFQVFFICPYCSKDRNIKPNANIFYTNMGNYSFKCFDCGHYSSFDKLIWPDQEPNTFACRPAAVDNPTPQEKPCEWDTRIGDEENYDDETWKAILENNWKYLMIEKDKGIKHKDIEAFEKARDFINDEFTKLAKEDDVDPLPETEKESPYAGFASLAK